MNVLHKIREGIDLVLSWAVCGSVCTDGNCGNLSDCSSLFFQ